MTIGLAGHGEAGGAVNRDDQFERYGEELPRLPESS
jgi:hypothetical protein